MRQVQRLCGEFDHGSIARFCQNDAWKTRYNQYVTYCFCASTQHPDLEQPRQEWDGNFGKHHPSFLIGVYVIHYESREVGAENCWAADADKVANAILQRGLDSLAGSKSSGE